MRGLIFFLWRNSNDGVQGRGNLLIGVQLSEFPRSLLPPLYAAGENIYTENIGRCFFFLRISYPFFTNLKCVTPQNDVVYKGEYVRLDDNIV